VCYEDLDVGRNRIAYKKGLRGEANWEEEDDKPLVPPMAKAQVVYQRSKK